MDSVKDFVRVTTSKPANIVVPMALFYTLSPRAFVAFPGLFAALQSALQLPVQLASVKSDNLLSHTLAFGVAYATLRYNFPEFY